MEKDKVYVFEGKTSTEAIEKGLNELKVSKAKVDIKILESEDKRSFFSILTPRVVKVEMRLKDNVVEEKKPEVKKEAPAKKTATKKTTTAKKTTAKVEDGEAKKTTTRKPRAKKADAE